MVVKEKRGRRRYIAFEVDRMVSDEDMLSVLAGLQARGVKGKMIQFNGLRGIFRCRPQTRTGHWPCWLRGARTSSP